MKNALFRSITVAAGVSLVIALAPSAIADPGGSKSPAKAQHAAVDCSWSSSANITLDQAFDKASQSSGVPADVLKAVSYMESRWDNHDGKPSADGGYGPMNLTDLAAADNSAGKGDKSTRHAASTQTAALGARLTGLKPTLIKNNANANVCAGAAVLASYQAKKTNATKSDAKRDVNAWTDAVTRFGAVGSGQSNAKFASQVFTVLHSGASRVTANGQRVTLAAQPAAKVPASAASGTRTDCPPEEPRLRLGSGSVPEG